MGARPTRSPSLGPSVEEAHAAIACLARLTEITQQRRAQLATAAGLTDQQWGVLEEISTEHFMPSLFARRRESSAAAVSKILRQLSVKGLIVAQIAHDDARQRNYSLTAKGRRVMDRLRASREVAIRDLWLTLDASRLRAFTEFGRIIIERLEQFAKDVASQQE